MNPPRIASKERVPRNVPFAVILSIFGMFATNTRAAEHFPIDFGRGPTGDVTLHFDAEPNQTYQVQASSDLDSWVDHGTLIEDAAGPMVIRISPGHQKRGFFRVVAETQLPGTDLALRIGNRLDLPAMRLAGDGTTFDVPLEVENVGDDPTPALGSISIAVLAKNLEDGEEVEIVVETPSLRALKAGASTSIQLSDLSFPAGLSGEHSLVVACPRSLSQSL